MSKPQSDHVEQATIYGVLLELDLIHYIYVCKETAEIQIFETSLDKKKWHQIATRAETIVQKVKTEELPPKLEGKAYICKSCKYGWTCRPEYHPPDVKRMFHR